MLGLFLRLSLLFILCRQVVSDASLEIARTVEQGKTATLTWRRDTSYYAEFTVRRKKQNADGFEEERQVKTSERTGKLEFDFPTPGSFVFDALYLGQIIATSQPILVQPHSGPPTNPAAGPPTATRSEDTTTPGTTSGDSTTSSSTPTGVPSNSKSTPSQSTNGVSHSSSTSLSPSPSIPAPAVNSQGINSPANTTPISSSEASPTGISAEASGGSSSGRNKTGIIVGCVIGGLILLVGGFLLLFYLRRQRQRRELEKSAQRFSNYAFPVSVQQNLDNWAAARPELHHTQTAVPMISIPPDYRTALVDLNQGQGYEYDAQYDGYGTDEKVAFEERPGYGYDAHPEWQEYDQDAAPAPGYGYGYGYGQVEVPGATNYTSATDPEGYDGQKLEDGVGSDVPKPQDGSR